MTELLTNEQIRILINIESSEVFAHGYTVSGYHNAPMRNVGPATVDIYFEKCGEKTILNRLDYDRNETEYEHKISETFDAEFFFAGIKRWYRKYTNEKIVQLFKTFGRELSMVD